jgi:hypothetical protein
MAATTTHATGSSRGLSAGSLVGLGLMLGAAVGGGGVWYLSQQAAPLPPEAAQRVERDAADATAPAVSDEHASEILFPEASWAAASLAIEPASVGFIEQLTSVTWAWGIA